MCSNLRLFLLRMAVRKGPEPPLIAAIFWDRESKKTILSTGHFRSFQDPLGENFVVFDVSLLVLALQSKMWRRLRSLHQLNYET